MKRKIAITILMYSLYLLFAGVILQIFDTDSDVSLNYKYAGIPSENKIFVSDGKKFGYYDLKEKKVSLDYTLTKKMKNDSNGSFENYVYKNNFALYNDKDNVGIIDSFGKVIIKAQYDEIQIIKNNYFIAVKDYMYTLRDMNNNSVIGDYNSITQMENSNLLLCSIDELSSIYNMSTNSFITTNASDIYYTKEHNSNQYILNIKEQDQPNNYYYNDENNEIRKLENTGSYDSTDFIYPYVVLGTETGYDTIYNLEDNNIIKLNQVYMGLNAPSNGLMKATNEELKTGFIDLQGNVIVPYKYYFEGTSNFNEDNTVIVQEKEKLGLVDNKGNVLIPCIYDELTRINNNAYVGISNDKSSLVDKNNKKLITGDYSTIVRTSNDKLLLIGITKGKNETFGLMDLSGKIIEKPIYTDITINDNYYVLNKNNKYSIKQITK